MAVTFRKLHPHFVAEAAPIDLRRVHDPETLAAIRAGMDDYALLVFRDQRFSDEEHLDFARRLDGELHTKTGISALKKSRFGNEALADVSNLTDRGQIQPAEDRRRMYGLGNRLWHTDASFQDPPGRYSMLFARVIPPVGADTEYADMRAAYDALSPELKARLEGLRVHHSIAHSREILGFDFKTAPLTKRARDSEGGGPSPGSEPAALGPQVALYCRPRLTDHRLAAARGPAAAARTD